MKLPPVVSGLVILIFALAAPLTRSLAVTYPAASSFLWGNSSVNQPGKTSLVAGAGLPYRFLLPKNYDPSIKYPVVIFLHGQGETGTNNTAQLGNGANGAMTFVSTASPDNQTLYPCILVCPQTTGDWRQRAPQISDIITTLKTHYSVDEDRITLTGLSLGALGSWSILLDLPNTFNCLVTICGGGGTASIEKLPVWVFHAEDDSTVICNGSDNAVGGLRNRGIPVLYTRYQSGNHGIWTQSYQRPELVPWVMAQRRGQPIQSMPSLQVLTTSLGASPLKVTGTTVLPPTMGVTRVGWCRSNNGGLISGSDGVTNGGTTFVSGTANFLSTDLGGYRIAIRKAIGGSNSPFFYDVNAVTSGTSLTLNRSSSAQNGLSYTLYKPGTYANVNPWPGTTTNNWSTWSVDVPVSNGNQIVQIIGELSLSSSSLGGRTTYNFPLNISYTAPTGDTEAPTLSVSTPPSPFTTSVPSVTLAGSAFDNVGVVSVSWINDRGPSGNAAGTSAWTIYDLPLSAGVNHITVTAKDAKNNAATSHLQVYYTPPPGADTVAPQVTITAPTANDTYRTIHNTISLSGTAFDNGTIASLIWTNVTLNSSGPAIGATNWSANAIPLTPGTNVIRVTATDLSGGAGSDIIVVDYDASGINRPPEVNAGADQNITLPAPATLSGTVWDEGLPSDTVTTTWSKVSGAGIATFSNPSGLTTDVTFSVAGTYHLRLTASDGALSASDDVTVNVSPSGAGGDTTQRLNFDFGASAQPTAVAGWNNVAGNSVGTGVPNGVDSTGASTGIGVSITRAFQGTGDNGASSPSSPYPQTAMRDFIYSQNSPGILKFTGLDPAASYQFTIFGYRNQDAADRIGKYTIGTQTLTLNASLNTTQTAVFTGVKAAADGSLELTVDREAGSTFGYLNVLVIEKEDTPPAEPPVLNMESAVSRKTHGTVGNFDIGLPLSGAVGIESRSAGEAGHTIVLTFDGDLEPEQAGLEVETSSGQLAETPVVSGSTLTLRITEAPNAGRCTIALGGLKSAAGFIYSGSLAFGILEGDTNANQAVNVADAAVIRQHSGQPVDASNFRSDINANGAINVGDSAIQRQRSGTNLP